MSDIEQGAWFTEAQGEDGAETRNMLPPPAMEQNQSEFFWMLATTGNKIGKITSVLEIGSREGGALRQMIPFLNPGARVCSIDIGKGHPEWQNGRETVSYLRGTIGELREKGFDARVMIADSANLEAVAWAKDLGPFDLVIVDGDHDYSAVRDDWDNYGELGKIVAFHDLKLPGVAKMWERIIARGRTTDQMVADDGTGIGLVYEAAP